MAEAEYTGGREEIVIILGGTGEYRVTNQDDGQRILAKDASYLAVRRELYGKESWRLELWKKFYLAPSCTFELSRGIRIDGEYNLSHNNIFERLDSNVFVSFEFPHKKASVRFRPDSIEVFTTSLLRMSKVLALHNVNIGKSAKTKSPTRQYEAEKGSAIAQPNESLKRSLATRSPTQVVQNTPKKQNKTPIISRSTKEKYGGQNIGFDNLGRTCYVSATLQSIFATGVVEKISSGQIPQGANLTGALTTLYRNRWCPTGAEKTVLLKKLWQTITENTTFKDPTVSQDAYELLIALLSQMKEEWTVGETDQIQKSTIDEYFYFHVRTFIHCVICGYRKRLPVDDYTNAICIPLPKNATATVQLRSVLRSYFQRSSVESNCYCEEPTVLPAKNTLCRTPRILTLRLSRYSQERGIVRKNECLVEVPIQLTIKSYCAIDAVAGKHCCNTNSDEQTNYEYSLVAAVEHIGHSLADGHYIAHVNVDGEWRTCDDQTTTTIKTSELASTLNNAYLLFYRRTEENVANSK